MRGLEAVRTWLCARGRARDLGGVVRRAAGELGGRRAVRHVLRLGCPMQLLTAASLMTGEVGGPSSPECSPRTRWYGLYRYDVIIVLVPSIISAADFFQKEGLLRLLSPLPGWGQSAGCIQLAREGSLGRARRRDPV